MSGVFQIIRVEGYAMNAVGGISIHDNRIAEKSHTNEDIDWGQTILNYDLHNREKGVDGFPVNIDYEKEIKARIEKLNLPKALRSDANVMAQIFVSASPEFFNTNDNGEPHDWKKNGLTETQRKYFDDAYDFACKKYGKENIISARVHLDEATPHLHINFVPIVKQNIFEKTNIQRKNKKGELIFDKKKENPVYELRQVLDEDGKPKTRTTVCYSDLFTEKPQVRRGREGGQLTALHDNFFAHNQSRGYKLERGELQSVTGKKTHLDTLNFKKQERAKEVAALETEKNTATVNIEAEKKNLEATKKEHAELTATVTALKENKDKLKEEFEEFQAETERHYETTLSDAQKRLQEALEPIEEQIDVALAEKANNSVMRDIEVKKQPVTGAIVLSRATKGKTLTVEQVESFLELAKNRRSHEIRCNDKVKAAEAEVTKIKASAKNEVDKYKATAKEATDAWENTIAVYKGIKRSGKLMVETPADVAEAAKYFMDGYFKKEKAAERVPELEKQISALEKEKKTLSAEKNTIEATTRKELEVKINNLEIGVCDGYTAAAGLLASLRTFDLPSDVTDFLEIAKNIIAMWTREEIPYMSEKYKKELEVQAIRAETEVKLAPPYFKALYPEAAEKAEKERLRSLHKTKTWDELTPEEKKEVRRLLVHSSEFPIYQDFLDFKRAFKAAAERGIQK